MKRKILNEQINHLILSNYRFVLFKNPNEEFIQLYAQQNLDCYNSGFIINNFLNTERHFIYPELSNKFTFEDYYPTHQVILPRLTSKKSISEKEKTKEEYISMVKNAIEKLDEKFKKIVLSRIIYLDNSSFNEIDHFIKLCKENSQAFIYIIYIPSKLCWMGASPELLIDFKNQNLTTISLAGTKKIKENWTNKEFEEQQIVTDYIIDIAKNLNIEVSIGKTLSIKNPSGFEHLKTQISAKNITNDQAEIFLSNLHPSPAVCGIPKEVALVTIKNLENYERSFYTGYIGLKEENKMQLFVNLRCASIFDNNILMYVGGGITKKSNPQKEWEETELKSKAFSLSY